MGPDFGDVLSFTAHDTVEYYSDSGPNDPPDALADNATFPTRDSLFANYFTLNEVGPEGSNGFFYTPAAGQPGFNAAVTATAYGVISDAPIPDAASSVSLGPLLMLGGLVVVSRRRKAA